MARVSNKISNEVRGISRVVYGISNKPPTIIEWARFPVLIQRSPVKAKRDRVLRLK